MGFNDKINLAEEMARFYCKGFGNGLSGILNQALLFSFGIGDLFKRSVESYKTIEGIMDFYETIPFRDLQGREEFLPLFDVREKLPEFLRFMDSLFLSPKSNEYDFERFEKELRYLFNAGKVYGDFFDKIVKDIRLKKGYSSFRLSVRHHNGDIWEIPEI